MTPTITAFEASPDEGRLVPEPGDGWPHPSFLDLQMLVGSGGRERTREEMAGAFAANGLRLVDVIRTAAPTALYVGAPV